MAHYLEKPCWAPVLLARLRNVHGAFSASLHPSFSWTQLPHAFSPYPWYSTFFTLFFLVLDSHLLLWTTLPRVEDTPIHVHFRERIFIIEASVLWHSMSGYLFPFVWRVNLVSSKMIENMFILLRLFEVGRMWWQLWVNSSKTWPLNEQKFHCLWEGNEFSQKNRDIENCATHLILQKNQDRTF